MDNKILILKFGMDGGQFAIKVSDIQEVNRVPEILPANGNNISITGFINLHGKIVPVVSDKEVYDAKAHGMTKDLFIALKTENSPVCILVNELSGFQRINSTADNENIQTKNGQKYSETIFNETGKMFLLLDADYFLSKVR